MADPEIVQECMNQSMEVSLQVQEEFRLSTS